MITHFKIALNRIEAPTERIALTRDFLRREMDKKPIGKGYSTSTWFSRNRMVAVACVFLLMLVGSAGFYKYYTTPTAYISIDINPSVEIGVNGFSRVVGVEGCNVDGQKLVGTVNVEGRQAGEAVRLIAEAAIDNGYIADDGSTIILMSIQSDDTEQSIGLESEVEAGIKSALANKDKQAKIIIERADLSLRSTARTLGITAGKLAMIDRLLQADSRASREMYLEAGIQEIMRAIQNAEKDPVLPGENNGRPSDNDVENGNQQTAPEYRVWSQNDGYTGRSDPPSSPEGDWNGHEQTGQPFSENSGNPDNPDNGSNESQESSSPNGPDQATANNSADPGPGDSPTSSLTAPENGNDHSSAPDEDGDQSNNEEPEDSVPVTEANPNGNDNVGPDENTGSPENNPVPDNPGPAYPGPVTNSPADTAPSGPGDSSSSSNGRQQGQMVWPERSLSIGNNMNHCSGLIIEVLVTDFCRNPK